MINEMKLIPQLNFMHTYNARDIADLCFCHMLALHLFRSEFETAPWARKYARETMLDHSWDEYKKVRNDLHQLLSLLIGKPDNVLPMLKDTQASLLFIQEISLDTHDVLWFLNNIHHVNFDPELSGRLLLKMERELKISTSNYKSMRRILSDWHLDHVDTHAQSLVVTRLLQVFRAKAGRGEFRPKLETLAKSRSWELSDVCDAETGSGCETAPHVVPQKPSIMKQLAVGAGLGVGAYLLGRALFGGGSK